MAALFLRWWRIAEHLGAFFNPPVVLPGDCPASTGQSAGLWVEQAGFMGVEESELGRIALLYTG